MEFCKRLLLSGICSVCFGAGLALLRFRDRVVSDPFGALSNWNDDVGVIDPCLWHGIECSEGNVVVLNLKDLCLGGTLAPDLRNLLHMKSIILRNNSFCGIIPEEIGELEELEVLDLGCNNFSGPLPSDLGNNLSLSILLLDNNELFGSISPEHDELKMLSEVQVDENHLSYDPQRSLCKERFISWNMAHTGYDGQRRLLKATATRPASSPKMNFVPTPEPIAPSPSPSPSLSTSAPSSAEPPSPTPSSAPKPSLTSPSPAVSGSPPVLSAPVSSPSGSSGEPSKSRNHRVLVISVATGVSVLLVVLMTGVFFCQRNKVVTVKPWATGLSGQLQKAFVTGVPKLKRSELETACEDFSNVISSSSVGTVYKGTLSSGVEIAVASIAVTSVKDWSKNLETQFRKKIDLLSKVNHKNFVNLIGYCEEEEPFTRMMVFEYAPNGTLFEHLHIKEAEHLDWGMRMRIIMGMAYCLEHMHQSTPPIAHKHLNSSAVHLTEDYAAKLSDFGQWNEIAAIDREESCPESNIYAFGVLLFEMITGRLPYSVDSGSLNDWASDYLSGKQPLREMVDPTLNSFQAEQLEKIGEVINSCVHPDLRLRPGMNEVTARLREITYIGPDAAIPKLSPLWWAELEILSTEAN
ncbi:hypothetical protein RJ639_001828 [Escallonia herrerae]|uniref:Protein kinase domain-containing protein n=1 Tax=Escallonia herrerae TaxID=1293975 RepID=A0AA88X8R7_9ASTE|nr:hypothetical protein RJ639_001828 [Escallonia herrerae]